MSTEFKAGAKVKFRGMVMPAEVLSGPHTSPGRSRYLIRKADGNVSLVYTEDIERIAPRLDQVAGTMAMNLYGRSYATLDYRTQIKVAQTAQRLLDIADRTRGEA